MPALQRQTKAQIIEYAQSLEVTLQQGPTWPDVARKVRSAAVLCLTEAVALARDTYNLGRQCRVWYDQAVAELSRPVLRKP
jgi:hypothetical protein